MLGVVCGKTTHLCRNIPITRLSSGLGSLKGHLCVRNVQVEERVTYLLENLCLTGWKDYKARGACFVTFEKFYQIIERSPSYVYIHV